MAAPAYRSKDVSGAGTGTNITGVEPLGAAADDILVADLYIESTTTVTPPSGGWSDDFGGTTMVNTLSTAGSEYKHYKYWIRRTGSAPALTWSFSSSWRQIALTAYSGALTSGNPWSFGAKAVRDDRTAQTFPAVSGTTSDNDELLVWSGENYNDAASNTPPTGFTERHDQGGADITIADLVQTSFGGTGSVTGAVASGSGSEPTSSMLAGLRPAGAGGSAPFLGTTFDAPLTRTTRQPFVTQSLLQTTLLPAPAGSPFFGRATDVPRQALRSRDLLTWATYYTIDDTVPFSQEEWPNPIRALVRAQDFVAGLSPVLFVVPGVPFSLNDWPNPIRAKTWSAGLSWQNDLNTLLFVAPPTLPFRQSTWPNPTGPVAGIALRGFAQASAFWMLRDTMFGAGQPFVFAPPVNPRGAQFPIELRGSAHNALTTVPTPPIVTFNPAWAHGSNRTVGFGIEPK
jgi:hypothetical protein